MKFPILLTIILVIIFISAGAAQLNADSSSAAGAGSGENAINLTWLFFKTIGMLVVIIILILLSVYLMKKFLFNPSKMQGGSNWMRVLGQAQIFPKKYLTLVKVFDRIILVGSTENGMQSLAEFNNSSEVKTWLEQMEKPTSSWQETGFFNLLKKKVES